MPGDRKGRRDHTHRRAVFAEPAEPGETRNEAPKFEIISDGVDIFVVADGVKIAKRGSPDTPHANTWVSLEPGWTAMDKPPDKVVIEHNGVRVH